MPIYDISLTISPSLFGWPGDGMPQMERVLKMEDGDIANVTHLNMSAHTGTHIDAPYHFLKDGNTVENLPLDILIGQAQVIEITGEPILTAQVLKEAKIPPNTKRLLIKTQNSEQWKCGAKEFIEDYVAISGDGAEYLVELGVQLVGVDYLSVAPFDAPIPTHRTLLGASVVIIEALNLADIEPGTYTLYCLPLKLAGADGAPARVVLHRQSN